MFHSISDRALQVGHIEDSGLYIATHSTQLVKDEFHPFTQATDVVSTGDALVFYIAASGKTIVGTVDRQGQFLETQSLTLTTMWTDVAATAR